MKKNNRNRRCPYNPGCQKAAVFREFSQGKHPAQIYKEGKYRLTKGTLYSYFWEYHQNFDHQIEVIRAVGERSRAGETQWVLTPTKMETWRDLTRDLGKFIADTDVTFFRAEKPVQDVIVSLLERWQWEGSMRREFIVSNLSARAGNNLYQAFYKTILGVNP